MATVYGANATLQYQTTPPSKVVSSLSGGPVVHFHDSYEFAASAAGTIVRMFRVREGDQILGITQVRGDDLGTGVTLDVIFDPEDDGTDVELSINIDAATAAFATTIATGSNVDNFPYEVTEDGWIAIETADAAATGTVYCDLYVARN